MMTILEIVLPTFFVIVIGYLVGRFTRLNMSPVVDIAIYFGAPALAFVSLMNKDIVLLDAAKVWAAAVVIMLGCGAVAWLVFKAIRQRHSGLYASVMLMNSMYIPFPIVYLAYGVEGLGAATLFYIPNMLLVYTLGVYIMAGKRWKESIREVFKLPSIYAALLGLALNLLRVEMPGLVISSLDMLGKMTLPLVLLVLGCNLSRVKLTSLPTTLLASVLRVGVGLLLGLLLAEALSITGVYRAVVILVSAMPAAAMTSILSAKYNNEPDLVSSVVFLTTIASLVIIPFLLYMLA